MIKIKFFIFILLSLVFSGCISSTTKVLSVPKYEEVSISYMKFKLEQKDKRLSKEDEKIFEENINEVFTKNGYQIGNGLKIAYSVLNFEKGNSLLRYVGFGLGKAQIKVKFYFYDYKTERLLGEIETSAELSSAILGDSFNDTIGEIANKVYMFSKKNYLN